MPFADTVAGWYRRRRADCGLPVGETGAETVIQRASSDLRLNPHLHQASRRRRCVSIHIAVGRGLRAVLVVLAPKLVIVYLIVSHIGPKDDVRSPAWDSPLHP
jgi:hypothetical protein